MSTERPETQTFVRLLQTLDLDAQQRGQSVDATFVPDRFADPASFILASLPRLALAGDDEHAAELAMQDVLGEGGRGQVWLARQLSLRRQVAVKSLKGPQEPALTVELLREARITGGLEHPNIVPIYALGRDAHDRVLLVMRKVDGVPWGKLLRDEGAARTDAQIERHLEIFRQVCNAVEFAHSQGIVHRDLKPDNVMIGAFGEVVVLDWGLAVSLQGDATRDLPPASAFRGLAGTPSYMPPELVSGDGALVGRWTDLYLLGATLHEIVSGSPPHRGADLEAVLERAYRSEPPTYADHVPPEIAEVCRRAMAAEPQARFDSVAALREAVVGFGRHRQSAQLASEAARRLASVEIAGSQVLARSALAQARFGVEQALRTWPENPSAHATLAAARICAVELELAAGDVAGAEHALGEIASPPPALVERLGALRRERAQRDEELLKLRAYERELNPDVSQRGRTVMLVITALVWGAVPVAMHFYMRHFNAPYSNTMALWSELGFAATVGLGAWVGRKSLMVNRIGRRIAAVMVMALGFSTLVRVCGLIMNLPQERWIAFEVITYALISAMAALFVDVRFSMAAVVYAVCALLIAGNTDVAMLIVGASNLFALLPMAAVWERVGRPECEEIPGAGPSRARPPL